MADVARHWPGGIPEDVRFHPEPIPGPLISKVKGWQLFLEENSMISPRQQDDISKADLRRRLVQQWAGMTQEERDDFQRRAPVRKEHVWYPKQFRGTTRQPTSMINLVVPQPMDARNCALWTKLRIMLYHLDGDDGFIFDEPNGEPTIPDLEPSNASPLTADNFFHRQYLEGADFDHIAMTSTGTVICHSYQETLLLADQEALDTGLMLLARVENNGQVVCSGRVWPVMMAETYLGTQNSVDEILDRDTFSQDRLRHMRVNMEEPILDILESKAPYIQTPDIDLWMEAIERCAPGYLELEEVCGGMVPNYDHAKFRSHQELVDMPWSDELQ